MAPHTYKLTYFDARGLAELTRLLFAYGGLEYEDIRINREQWPEYKPKQPFGQLPTLDIDGVVISQSQAIARYVAKEIGLVGNNNLEAAKCDMVMDGIRDTFMGLAEYRREEDEEKKKAIKTKFFTETLPPFLNNLEKMLKQNNGPYFLGDSISWADIGTAYFLGEIQNFDPSILDISPGVKALVKNVFEIPQLKEWIEKRPKTQF